MLSIILLLPALAFSQLYKAEKVFIENKETQEFKQVGHTAYLDYNLKDKYAELIFNDRIYLYHIQKSLKPDDEQRFIVQFKKTDDHMLWNVKEEGNYIFAFKIGRDIYWFRDVSNCEAWEIDAYKGSIIQPE